MLEAEWLLSLLLLLKETGGKREERKEGAGKGSGREARAGVAEQSIRLPGREEHVLPNRGSEPTDSPPRVLTQHRRGCQASPVPEQAGVPVVATALLRAPAAAAGTRQMAAGTTKGEGLYRPTGRQWALVHP